MRGPWSPQTFGESQEAFRSELRLQQGLWLGGPLPTQESGDVSLLVRLGRLYLAQLELETSSTVSAERRSQICRAPARLYRTSVNLTIFLRKGFAYGLDDLTSVYGRYIQVRVQCLSLGSTARLRSIPCQTRYEYFLRLTGAVNRISSAKTSIVSIAYRMALSYELATELLLVLGLYKIWCARTPYILASAKV